MTGPQNPFFSTWEVQALHQELAAVPRSVGAKKGSKRDVEDLGLRALGHARVKSLRAGFQGLGLRAKGSKQ